MSITSGNHSFVLNEATTAVAINQFTMLPGKMPILFEQAASDSAQEQHASVSGLGKFQVKQPTGTSARDESVQQYERLWVHNEYSLVIPFERKYVDDEKFSHFRSMGAELGNSAMRTTESFAAKVFTDAFVGAEVTAEDGKSLCNNAHTNVDAGNSQDNYGTNALDYAGYKTTRIAHRKFTDYRGEKISINPDTLVVPIDLEEAATQVARAAQKPGSTNNDLNAFLGVDVVVWEYLTDTNAWFSVDSMMMRQANPWFWRIGLEFFGNRDWDTMLMSVGGYTRFSFGPSDWRWVYGNNPS